MMNKNLILLPNCSGKVSFEGEPVKAVGYYSHETNKRLNTIGIYTINFTGRITIYGTTKLEPTEEDWGIVKFDNGYNCIDFNNLGNYKSHRCNTFVNIEGSYTWLKAKMDRDNFKILREPKPFKKYLTHLTDNVCCNPLSHRFVEITPDPSYELKYFGNVEGITLSY